MNVPSDPAGAGDISDSADSAEPGAEAAGKAGAAGLAVWQSLHALRETRPLVHNITNFVAMDLAANLLLAAGASPVMAHAPEEVEDIAAAAGALSVNIGTLDEAWVASMIAAARAAVEAGRPWVLDPVGAGATEYRTATARRLAGLQPSVIRANGSEIMALEAREGHGQGVDSGIDSVDALDAACALAQGCGAVVAVTGVVDYVTDGRKVLAVANGDPVMGRVTAMGCALTTLVAGFLAVEPDPLKATAHALAAFGVAGEVAAERAQGPGSFRMNLLDVMAELDETTLVQRVQLD
jgi:hydroxyethylthiazole kinase